MNADTLAADPDAQLPVRRLRHAASVWFRHVLALALAALGLFLALSWWSEPGSPVVYEDGALVAAGRLEQALYDPSLGGRESGPSVGAEFRSDTGRACRRFADGPVNGIACQIEGDWRVIEMRQR